MPYSLELIHEIGEELFADGNGNAPSSTVEIAPKLIRKIPSLYNSRIGQGALTTLKESYDCNCRAGRDYESPYCPGIEPPRIQWTGKEHDYIACQID